MFVPALLQQHAKHTVLLNMLNADLILKTLNLEAPCVRKIKDKSRASSYFSIICGRGIQLFRLRARLSHPYIQILCLFVPNELLHFREPDC